MTVIVFRVDASLQIGTGHVMRCLTLAAAMTRRGAVCHFVCREHPGNLIELIRSKGYVVHPLPQGSAEQIKDSGLVHCAWLGASQEEDAQACKPILNNVQPKWLVVDHYALDRRWQLYLKPYYQKMLVIDDLADREHVCDVLLDQTFGRVAEDYRAKVPIESRLLCGSQYALLRPEFLALRGYSEQRRALPTMRKLLITMGGVDKDNASGRVLEVVRGCLLPRGCEITVVMGATAPWLPEVKRQALEMPWPTRVMVDVRDMAQLMAESDLAIGAAGATSWERCCLGLPTVMLVLADNQRFIGQALETAGAAVVIDRVDDVAERLPGMLQALTEDPEALGRMSRVATSVVEGTGVDTVIDSLEDL